MNADGQTPHPPTTWISPLSSTSLDSVGTPVGLVLDCHESPTGSYSSKRPDPLNLANIWLPSATAEAGPLPFISHATNLVPGDTNGRQDVFVHDRETDSTVMIGVDDLGNEGNGESTINAISDDGRYIAFESHASNLVPGDTNLRQDVFLHDLGDADGDGEWDPFDSTPEPLPGPPAVGGIAEVTVVSEESPDPQRSGQGNEREVAALALALAAAAGVYWNRYRRRLG